MKLTFLLMASALVCVAQQRGPQTKQAAPPLMDCGSHGDTEIICGTRSPEDLELTPDNKYLIVPRFVNTGGRGGAPKGTAAAAGMDLLDLAKNMYSKLPITSDPRKDWGDPACPGFIGDALVPHGISLGKRNGGAWQLYVVNHGSRQSIEMFELKQTGGAWGLIWHGCVPTKAEFNDVAVMPDGGFIATHPTALQVQGQDLFTGSPSGWVARWSASKGEEELPDTRRGYPNGVLVSADGRYMYFNAWTAKEVHKYDLKANKELGMVKLDFMPDNITWTKDHRMLAAGVKGTRGNCPPQSATPCNQGFGVALIDPGKMTSKTVFDSEGKGALIGGVSVALQVGPSMYIGAFSGDRVVKVPFQK